MSSLRLGWRGSLMSADRHDRAAGSEQEASAIDALTFRRTMGHLATGVTIVTVYGDDGAHGMTANAVTSVSLHPPLILFCVDRKARTARYVQRANAFAVNILRETQEPLSRFFAGSWRAATPPEHRFEEWAGTPYLIGSLGAISCRLAAMYDGGDHLIVVGRVVGLRVDEPAGQPLLFYRGQYAGLIPHDTSPPESPELMSYDKIRMYYGEWAHDDEDDGPGRAIEPAWFP